MATVPPIESQLLAEYDRLVEIDQLVHGEHNPRRVAPQPALHRPIAQDGLQRPLIVRSAAEEVFTSPT